MQFDAVFIDADNTLFDFDKTQEKAIAQTLTHFSLPKTADVLAVYEQINADMWDQYHKGRIQNHEINPLRWQRWLNEVKPSVSVGYTELAVYFADSLAQQCEKEPGAEELIQHMTQKLPVHVITNGFPSSQKYRWHKAGWHDKLHGITVSAEVGVQKPHPAIFRIAMEAVGVRDSQRCLMIGDHIEADVKGPQMVGMKGCWYQRKKAQNLTETTPDFTVTHLSDIIALV